MTERDSVIRRQEGTTLKIFHTILSILFVYSFLSFRVEKRKNLSKFYRFCWWFVFPDEWSALFLFLSLDTTGHWVLRQVAGKILTFHCLKECCFRSILHKNSASICHWWIERFSIVIFFVSTDWRRHGRECLQFPIWKLRRSIDRNFEVS